MFNIITLEQKVPKKTRFGDYEPIIEHFIKFDIMKVKDSKVGTNFKSGSPQQMRTSGVKFTGDTSSAMKLNKKAEAEITKEEGKNKTLPEWHRKFNEWRGKFTGNTLQKLYGQWQKNGNSFKIQESNDEYQKRWTDELWAGYEKQLNQINEKFEKIKWPDNKKWNKKKRKKIGIFIFRHYAIIFLRIVYKWKKKVIQNEGIIYRQLYRRDKVLLKKENEYKKKEAARKAKSREKMYLRRKRKESKKEENRENKHATKIERVSTMRVIEEYSGQILSLIIFVCGGFGLFIYLRDVKGAFDPDPNMDKPLSYANNNNKAVANTSTQK